MKIIVGMMTVLGMALAGLSAEPAEPAGMELAPIINLDGDDAFSAMELSQSQQMLRAEVDRWADAGVRTLAYCVGAGSEIMLYPTKVADTWGWRKTSYDDDPRWSQRIERNRRNTQAGGDAPRTAGEQARARGMAFFPSLRMNDAHYAFGKPPEEYPLTGSFYLENRDLVIGQSPIRSKPEYGQLLDFSHEKVREHRMAQAIEVMDRYQDLMTGFEMDFTRFQVFFPPGKAQERGHLLTEMVARVRRHLDELGQANGRRYLLMVRVPPSPENCAWAGIQIERWINERLVDVVVPSRMMTTAFELPVDRFVRMARPRGVKVYATLLPRVGWRWEGDAGQDGLGPFGRDITLSQVRAAVVNMEYLGADGLYLFNFNYFPPLREGHNYSAIRELADSLSGQPLCFTATKAYWQDHEDSYQYRKEIPAALSLDEPQDVPVLIGIDPASLPSGALAVLRLGFRGIEGEALVTVAINGQEVFAGDLTAATKSPQSDSPQAKALQRYPDLASHVLDVPLPTPALLKQGTNQVRVALRSEARPVTLTDVEIQLDPSSR